MSHILKDCWFLLILGTLLGVGCTQTVTTNDPSCGESVIDLGSGSREFNIPSVGTATGPILCTYTITSKPFTNILYNITSLNIGDKYNCDENHLLFASTEESISEEHKICRNRIPDPPLETLSNTAYIVFNISTHNKMDSYVKGYLVVVSPENDEICGQRFLELTESSAKLRIPPMGESFQREAICGYNIRGSNDKALTFKVTNINLGSDGECDKDFLKVAEDEWHIDNTTYIVCGKETPKTIFKSTSNSMFVIMVTTTSPKSTFVEAIYSQEEITQDEPTNKPSCGENKIVLDSGWKEFNIPSNGMFTEPTECTFQVTSPPSTTIVYNISSMHIHEESSCETDYLKFASSAEGIGTAAKMCGTQIPKQPLTSTDNSAHIVFHLGNPHPTGDFVKGFLGVEPKAPAVTPNEASCGDGNIVLGYRLKEFNIPSKGTFTNSINCTYTITSPTSTNIVYDVTSMQVGDGSSCETDFLIFSSSWDSLRTAPKICGTQTPKQPFKSTSNTAYIMLSLGSTQLEGNFVKGVLSAKNSAPYLASSLGIIFYTFTCMWVHLPALT